MTQLEFPKEKGLLKAPIRIPNTNIEIIRQFTGQDITDVLFDFDGTISDERKSWPDIMVATNSAAIAQALPAIGISEAIDWTITEIEQTIGLPTYIAMKRLADYIKEQGGIAQDPTRYKAVYAQGLTALVDSRYSQVAQGTLQRDQLRLPGAFRLICKLNEYFPTGIHLGSGSDLDVIQKSVDLLGYREFFGNRIMAAGSLQDPSDCPKKAIIDRLIRERNLKPGQLLCFGDGFPEILNTYHAGGICVGVLSPDASKYEHKGHFTVEQKRNRLVNAGAHILVPDFTCADKLVDVIREYKF